MSSFLPPHSIISKSTCPPLSNTVDNLGTNTKKLAPWGKGTCFIELFGHCAQNCVWIAVGLWWVLTGWGGHWRGNKGKAVEERSRSHPFCSNIHEPMRQRNCSAPLQNLSPFPLHTCKRQALTVRLWPWGSHSFPLEPAVSNNMCILHLPKKNYTFFSLGFMEGFFIWNTFTCIFQLLW